MKDIRQFFKNPRNVRLTSVLIIFLAIAGIFLFFVKTQSRVNIDNSQVTAPITPMSSATPGILKKIVVTEGQRVKRGDALAYVGSDIVRAYTDGVIVQTSKQIGQLAQPGIPVVQMINTNNLRVDGTLDENKGLNLIRVGQVAAFTVDAYPGKIYWGYVDELSPSAKQTQLAFSISSERPTQQFDVFVKYDSIKYPEIKNGMSAKMVVYIASY